MRAVHTFKKDKANMENYFPSPLFQFRAASVLRARPAARPQGGTQPWAGQDAAASLGDTRSLRRGPLDSDSPAGSPLGRGRKPEHPERLCRCWEKAQTPHRQVHQVGINFFFFFFLPFQHYPVTTSKETLLFQDLLHGVWSGVPYLPLNILKLVSLLTFISKAQFLIWEIVIVLVPTP